MLSSLAFAQPVDGYIINGKFINGDFNGKVYITRGIHQTEVKLDSTTVVDNKFSFKGGPVEHVEQLHFRLDNGEATMFFLENGTINFVGDLKAFWMNSKSTGTLSNEIMNDYKSDFNRLLDKVRQRSIIARLLDPEIDIEINKEKAEALFNDNNKLFAKSLLDSQWEIVRKYRDHAIAPFMVRWEMTREMPIDTLIATVNSFEKLQDHPYVKELRETIKSMQLGVGNPCPDFTATLMDGKKVSLSDFKGRFLLLDFWASWCGPCLAEMPNVVKLYKSAKGKNFEILGISLDIDQEKWKNELKKQGMTWPQSCDLKSWYGQTCKTFNVVSVPHTVLISPDGTIVAMNLRGEALIEKVKELIKK